MDIKAAIITSAALLLIISVVFYITGAQVCAGDWVGDPQAKCEKIFK